MMNKQIWTLIGTDESEYRQWCRANNKRIHDKASQSEFFSRIQSGRLVRDETGKLVKKRVKSK